MRAELWTRLRTGVGHGLVAHQSSATKHRREQQMSNEYGTRRLRSAIHPRLQSAHVRPQFVTAILNAEPSSCRSGSPGSSSTRGGPCRKRHSLPRTSYSTLGPLACNVDPNLWCGQREHSHEQTAEWRWNTECVTVAHAHRSADLLVIRIEALRLPGSASCRVPEGVRDLPKEPAYGPVVVHRRKAWTNRQSIRWIRLLRCKGLSAVVDQARKYRSVAQSLSVCFVQQVLRGTEERCDTNMHAAASSFSCVSWFAHLTQTRSRSTSAPQKTQVQIRRNGHPLSTGSAQHPAANDKWNCNSRFQTRAGSKRHRHLPTCSRTDERVQPCFRPLRKVQPSSAPLRGPAPTGPPKV